MTSRAELRARFARRPPLVYGLLDTGLVEGEEMPEEARRLAAAGIELLQLRAKDLDARALFELAARVLEVTRAARVPLLIDDRVDVAAAVGADGVHVGADDLPAEAARAVLGPEAIVGATAHSLEELRALPVDAIDYVGYGAVFATRTRERAEVCGPEALTAAVGASTVPVVAIGGITPDNVKALRRSNVAGIAVAGSITPHRARPGAVEDLRRALESW